MIKTDIPTLLTQLNLLAEVYEKKPVSERAAQVWYDTLREFPINVTMDFLIHWPKAHNKFPVPADVWRVVNERMIDKREAEAKAMKAQERKEVEQWVRTPQGAVALEHMRKILGLPSKRSQQELDEMAKRISDKFEI